LSIKVSNNNLTYDLFPVGSKGSIFVESINLWGFSKLFILICEEICMNCNDSCDKNGVKKVKKYNKI
jgi:hypothetical protein